MFDLAYSVTYFRVVKASEEQRLKNILKDAVVEVLEDRRDLLRDAIRESLEDVALVRAIQQGEKSRLLGRKQVFKQFEHKA